MNKALPALVALLLTSAPALAQEAGQQAQPPGAPISCSDDPPIRRSAFSRHVPPECNDARCQNGPGRCRVLAVCFTWPQASQITTKAVVL